MRSLVLTIGSEGASEAQLDSAQRPCGPSRRRGMARLSSPLRITFVLVKYVASHVVLGKRNHVAFSGRATALGVSQVPAVVGQPRLEHRDTRDQGETAGQGGRWGAPRRPSGCRTARFE